VKKWRFLLISITAVCAVLWLNWLYNEPVRARREIVEQMRTLTQADLSVLKGSLERPRSQMMTVTGSANEQLWERLKQREWARQVAVPQGMPENIRLYELTDKGSTELSTLFASPRRNPN
jgi:hypothetical protein